MTFITTDDLAPFAVIEEAKAEAMIADAEAQAILAAPCLVDDETDLSAHQVAAVKAVLRSAILRWNDSGTGAFVQETAGPFSVIQDTRQFRRSLFWPSEIDQLQSICASFTGAQAGAFTVDPGATGVRHDLACSINFGALYCSCGADLTLAEPLYGS